MILDRSTLLSLAYCARWCPPPSCVDLLKKHLTHLLRHGSISLQRAVGSGPLFCSLNFRELGTPDDSPKSRKYQPLKVDDQMLTIDQEAALRGQPGTQAAL